MRPTKADNSDRPYPAGAGLLAIVAALLRTSHNREYLAAKAVDFRVFSSVTVLMASALVNGFILWDYAIDPVHAAQAIPWRMTSSGVFLIYGLAIWRDIESFSVRLLALLVPLALLAIYIEILSILDEGAAYGVGGFLYFFIFAPFAMLAQPVGYAIFILAVIAVFPPIAAQFGLSAGLDWPIYNAYVWLAFMPMAAIMLLTDYLYWHLFSYRRQVVVQATTDSLTRITNRRHFLALAAERLARHAEQQSPISLLFIDIDNFKSVNDRYGHAAGDNAICHVAQILGMQIRNQDVLARYGGEEFVALLSHTDEARAGKVAERMRAAVEREPLDHDQPVENSLELAISIGITSHVPGADRACDLDMLIHEADLALYEAKNAGRNRVVINVSPSAAIERRATGLSD